MAQNEGPADGRIPTPRLFPLTRTRFGGVADYTNRSGNRIDRIVGHRQSPRRVRVVGELVLLPWPQWHHVGELLSSFLRFPFLTRNGGAAFFGCLLVSSAPHLLTRLL